MPIYNLNVNNQAVTVDAPANMALLWVQRDKHGINGPKYGCGLDVCKACTCLVNGKAVSTCAVKISEVANKKVTTIEGLANGSTLHPVQQAWLTATCRSAASASRGRSWPRSTCSAAPRPRPMPTSTRSRTCAAAAPTGASARRSARPRR